MQLLAAYDFTVDNSSDDFIPEGLMRSADLAILISQSVKTENPGTGILVEHPLLPASRAPGSELTHAIQQSGAFSVEACIRPMNATQDGPARIVSLSDGIHQRNFTLGQAADAVIFRVRNQINGANGTEHELRVPDAAHPSLQHLVATYDHGFSTLYRDGRPLEPQVDLRDPCIYLLLGSRATGHVAASVLLVLTLTLPAYGFLATINRQAVRHLAALAIACAIASLPYLATPLLVGDPFRPDALHTLCLALLLAYPPAYLYVYRPPPASTAGFKESPTATKSTRNMIPPSLRD